MKSPKKYKYPINLIHEVFHYNEIFMDNIILPSDINETINYIFSLLKPQEVKILEYRYIDNLSYREISKIVNLSSQGISSAHNRILNKLCKYKEYFQMGRYMVENKNLRKYIPNESDTKNSNSMDNIVNNIVNSINEIAFLKLTSMDSLSISNLSIPKEDIIILNQHSIFKLSDLFSKEYEYICNNVRTYECYDLSYPYGISKYSEDILSEIKEILRTIEKLSIYDFLTNVHTKDHYKLLEYFQILNLYLLENVNQYDFETIGNKLIKYVGNSKICIIPDNIKIIGESAFENCTFLERVIFPKSIEVIEQLAFNGCTSLTIERLPSNMKTVYYNSFYGCVNYSDIDYTINKLYPNILISNNVLYIMEKNKRYSKINNWSKEEIISSIKKNDGTVLDFVSIYPQLNHDINLYLEKMAELRNISDNEIELILNNINVNYKQNALSKYITYASKYYSENEIEEILENKHMFTELEISYARNTYNFSNRFKRQSYRTMALKRLLNLKDLETKSKDDIYTYLSHCYFSNSQIEYAINDIGVDFKQNALNCIKNNHEREKQSWSKKVICLFLIDKGFNQEEIKYALENCNIDFKQVVLEYFENFIKDEDWSKDCMSRRTFRSFYDDTLFELDEIDYALNNIKGINFELSALNCLKYYIEEIVSEDDICCLNRKCIYDLLRKEEFKPKEIKYAIENIGIDFKQNALQTLNKIALENNCSKNYLFYKLINNSYQFTIEETEYALENCNIDFKQNALHLVEVENLEYSSDRKIYDFLKNKMFSVEDIKYVLEKIHEYE